MMWKKIFTLSVSIFLSACAGMPAGAPTTTPQPEETPTKRSGADCPPASNWTIEYHRTGGFVGLDQSLTLKSDGSLAVPAVDKQMTIPAAQVQAITDLLVQACPFEVGPMPGSCADCYNYELNIQMDGQTYTVQAVDTTLPEELRPLVTSLDEYLK